MNAGYVRLSKDDDRRNYSSIENQKLIISQYAAGQSLTIDRWYEDDGVSGYLFDRPGFARLMEDLHKDIDTVFVKDFSRLGRHNAKTLLLLDDLKEQGKHLIIIDDHYDNQTSADDTIGITTWFNERYVKDTSRKIRRALDARQKDGTLLTQPPFGYRRTEAGILETVQEEAECIRLIYDLYLQGYGYQKISAHLNRQGIPTPSMARREKELSQGHPTNRQVAAVWSGSMAKDILGNDFYAGTFRLHKRTRSTVHGKDRRVPKSEQYCFEHHHPPIISQADFRSVQELKAKRAKSRYKGSHSQWDTSKIPNPFGSCLFCKDCGHKLTPIERASPSGIRKYYICSTYNTKGKRYCAKSHLIEDQALMQDISNYIRLCRNALSSEIASYGTAGLIPESQSVSKAHTAARNAVQEELQSAKKQFQTLLKQKIRDIAANPDPDHETLVNESYDPIQQELAGRIHALEAKLCSLQELIPEAPAKESPGTALDALDSIIQKNSFSRKDIEALIERIEVDEHGMPEIELKYSLPTHSTAAGTLGARENEIFATALRLIKETSRDFTSASYLSKQLAGMGYPVSKKSILPYLALMAEMGILTPSGNRLKPYAIKSPDSSLINAEFT